MVFFRPFSQAGKAFQASRRGENFTLCLLFLAILWWGPGAAQAQTGFSSGEGTSLAGTVFGSQTTLFPEDGRIKILVVSLNAFGLTESAAEQIGLILQKNLSNTGHFAVVGPREANAVFEEERPDLVDCREIACGVESGKRLGADLVLVGNISMQDQVFIFNVRLIDTLNNITDYEEEMRFRDESMDEDLFRLANNISKNSLLTGRVLSTSIRGIMISLGKKQGLKIGDVLVVYKQEVPVNNLEGEQQDTEKKNIAIVKVLNVNENSSEAILVHSTEAPQVSHFAQTYLNPTRQITLMENTRRELDTGIRLENKIRPLALAPVLRADNERRAWALRLLRTEDNQRFWMWVGLGGGAATLVFLENFEETDVKRLRTFAAIVVTGWALRQFVQLGDEINDLRVEGRAKGYVSFDLRLDPATGAPGLALSYHF